MLAGRTALVLGGVALAAFLLFPLYWAVVASLRPEAELFGVPALFPKQIGFQHYRAVLETRALWRPLGNSLLVAGATSVLCVTLGSLCAYAIARLRFRGRHAVAAGILAIGMFPQISIVSPLYLMLRALGLVDTYPGLILPYLTFALPLAVWLLIGHFQKLPRGLEEAALLDGASRLDVLLRILLPLSWPGLATTAILTFVYCYNEFLFALSFTIGPEHQTVPVAIALFRGRYQVPWGEVMAAALLTTLPVVAAVLAFQRRIAKTLFGE
jgi:ABC-type glycerol-3-phosphate transport system permease component